MVMKKILLLFLVIVSFANCASVKANNDLNELSENRSRGDPDNPVMVKAYLQEVLSSPENRAVKAYTRRAYSPETKKNLFVYHCFYVFFKDKIKEHTLVFTATPKGSILDGCWMLDAETDVVSYDLFLEPDNPWEVEEYKGGNGETSLDLIKTTEKILERLDREYTFFGASHIKNIPWYHQLWIALVPPPVIVWAPIMLVRNTDNCISAVLETMVWE
jgi:hypothetical protein